VGIEDTNNQAVQGHIEYVYPYGQGLLIVGWCSAQQNETKNITITLGVAEREEQQSLDQTVRYWRPDVANVLQADSSEGQAKYGFVATFDLQEDPNAIELVGVNLTFNDSLDDSIHAALLIPEKEKLELAIGENWAIWYEVLKEASHSLSMHRDFENLVERFGKTDANPGIITAHQLRKNYSNDLRMAIDLCARVSKEGVLISGWVLSVNSADALSDLRVAGLKEQAFSFWTHLTKVARPDVIKMFSLRSSDLKVGFICYLQDSDLISSQVTLTASSESGAEISSSHELQDLSSDPILLTERLATLFHVGSSNMRELMHEQLGSAIKSSWIQYRQNGMLSVKEPHVQTFGKEPSLPKVSIIIPLYKRYDFVEYQLSQFALDPDLHDAEIIYVNDDPSIQDALTSYCHANYPLYKVPFKLIHAGKNLGYAGANNFGAALAKSPMLLLLNSDVMPKQAGWLSKMLACYKATPNIGALGARLLYEDGSLQHDGMSYERFPFFQDLWICEHPFKGLSPSLKPARQEAQEVEAVTGACLMTSKQSYVAVGGLDKNYILGDFEDSDYCLKLRHKRLKIYQLESVELYHLERQSQNLFDNNDWKSKLTIYNCWQHTQKWDKAIEALKGEMTYVN